MSWLTKSKVTPSFSHVLNKISKNLFLFWLSKAEVGSSASINLGLLIIDLIIAILCFWPTDKFLDFDLVKISLSIPNFSAKLTALLK